MTTKMKTFCYQQFRLGPVSILLLIVAIFASATDPVEGTRSPISTSLSVGIRSVRHGLWLNPSVIHQQRNSLRRVGMRLQDGCLANSVNRGGAVTSSDRRLHFWEAMVCGAISRSTAQTIMHPANTMKTILQSSRNGNPNLTVLSFTKWKYAKRLTRGAGAQLILSLPHGAVNFAVLELMRRQMNNVVSRSRYADAINRNFGPGMDFLSSALSTVCCSAVSTPQMMICDNIMAGTYPNLLVAARSLAKEKGISGFYTGWWPGIAGKIPSYVSLDLLIPL